MTKVNDDELILLQTKPADGQLFVRIRGRGFKKTGYLVWRPDLSLALIEREIGYDRAFGVPIYVFISRDGKRIFSARATESGPEGSNAGPIKPKPNAPELKPGDSIVADQIIG